MMALLHPSRLPTFYSTRNASGKFRPNTTVATTTRVFQELTKMQNLPYKHILSTTQGFVAGVDNVQRGVLDVGHYNADCLKPLTEGSPWRCLLDPYQWSMFDRDLDRFLFNLKLSYPERVVLSPTRRS
jgi:hypothetical protein